jgi:SDR family mycofactocin-dependent oxidoreductase
VASEAAASLTAAPDSAPRPVALVTGAARGIGAAVALALASAGWDLALGDVDDPDAVAGLRYPLAGPGDVAATARVCEGAGASVVTAVCDVRDPDQVAALVTLAGPRLRAAVSVAGVIGADAPAWLLTRSELELDLSVNMYGVVNLACSAVPVFLAGPDPARCRFVAVLSSASQRPLPRLASYVSAKHAALGYVQTLAADLGGTGVTANAVLPGSTRTALLERSASVYGLDSVEAFAAQQRIGRLIEPAEVANPVVWLCSEGASAVTGAALAVDGGFVG